MQHMTFQDSATNYTRISKREARKRYDNNLPFAICPAKMRPGFPFASHMMVHPTDFKKQELGRTFDKVVNSFTYYNCSHETGYYTAFYLTTNRGK